jgi:phosphonatase-like hydrolase
MNLQLIVFDMAGTTVDEDKIVYKTVHRAVVQAGYEVSFETVQSIAGGKKKLQAIRDVLAELSGGTADEDSVQAIYQDFLALLAKAYAENSARPMPGAELVFQKLQEKGIKVALNTGYPRSIAEQLLQQLGWLDHPMIDVVVTSDEVAQGRPHPDMIFLAMQKLGIKDAAMVGKIGDTLVDVQEGLNAGCSLSAGITTGAQTAEQLRSAGATHVFGKLEEVLNEV